MKYFIAAVIVVFSCAMLMNTASAHSGGTERGTSCHYHRDWNGKQIPGSRHCNHNRDTSSTSSDLELPGDEDGEDEWIYWMIGGGIVTLYLMEQFRKSQYDYSLIEKVDHPLEFKFSPDTIKAEYSIDFDF